MPLRAGACIVVRDSSNIDRLAILLTDPEGNRPSAVVVVLEPRDQFSDETVILTNEHRFFRQHNYCVRYRGAVLVDVSELENGIANPGDSRSLHNTEPYCSEELLRALRQGLLDSRATPLKYKEYCRPRFGF